MGGITVGPRQFTMMCNGTQMANGSFSAFQSSGWEAASVGGGWAYYFQTEVDLRGLLVDGENRGLNPLSVVLQESGPIENATPDTYFMIYDILSTVNLSEELIEGVYDSYATPGDVPGFLDPSIATPIDRVSDQDLNPSQVLWGMWRQCSVNTLFRYQAAEFATQIVQSGYFGQGEIAVSPHLQWTRIIRTMGTADTIIVPSTNLVIYADAVDLTQSQELTQMMRAVQR